MRAYKRDQKGKFSTSGGSGGSKGGKSKTKRKKKKQPQQVANFRRTSSRALGDTSKEGNVSITRRGTRKRVTPVRKKVKRVGGKPSKGTKKDKRIKKNKKTK